jgi:hypothetical protein
MQMADLRMAEIADVRIFIINVIASPASGTCSLKNFTRGVAISPSGNVVIN